EPWPSQIEPQRRRAECRASTETARLRDIDELARAGVSKETILADAGDQHVGKAVVVEIAHGDTHPVHLDIETGRLRHIGEGAVAVIAIQGKLRPLTLAARPIHAVDQQDVLP